MTVAELDPASTTSIIVRRHREEFEQLFKARYERHYGEGLQLRCSKRAKRIHYHPASGTLLRRFGSVDDQSLPLMPHVLGISSQFKEVIRIWQEAIDDLRAFGRQIRASEGVLTSEAFESLPQELQSGPHPEQEKWLDCFRSNQIDQGMAIVAVAELAAIKGLSKRDRLTKSQCQKLLRTADVLGLGVEPDARVSGVNYKWEEQVALFFTKSSAVDNGPDYMAASILLRLGATIAEADGAVDQSELDFITTHLEGQFDLSDSDSNRLEQLKNLLLVSRTGENQISRTLSKKLPPQHRLLVGEFLVGIAAVDNVITDSEFEALRKTFKSLEIDPASLDELVERFGLAKGGHRPPAIEELRLDLQAISKIMTETREVAVILRDAMADPDDQELNNDDGNSGPTGSLQTDGVSPQDESILTEPYDETAMQNLEPRYRPFVKALLENTCWAPSDLRKIADEHRVMLSGAIEAINEWSTDEYGDWLILEDDNYEIRTDLVKKPNEK